MNWNQLISSNAIAAYAVLVSLISVVVGPLISYWVTRKQIQSATQIAQKEIQASLVSANRQKWINTLRNDLAHFISCQSMLMMTELLNDNSLPKIMAELIRLNWKIKLLINPNEVEHQSLVKLIGELTRLTRDMPHSNDKNHQTFVVQAGDKRNEIVALSQIILKKEWTILKEEWNLQTGRDR